MIEEREYVVIVEPMLKGRHIRVFSSLEVAINQIESLECTIHFVPEGVCADSVELVRLIARQLDNGKYKAVKDYTH